MRTVADLQAVAKASGATLVTTSYNAAGDLVGEFSAPDVEDGDPTATAILLETLALQDELDSGLISWARTQSPAELLAWVQAHVAFEPEDIETFQSPAVSFAQGYGDCDDSERALVVLARAAGYPARFVYFLESGQPVHVTAQILCAPAGRQGSQAWRWAETTIPAKFGEHPFAAMKRLRMKRADMNGTPYVLQNGQFVALAPSARMQGMGFGPRRRKTMGYPAESDPNWPAYLGDTFATSLVNYSQSLGADPLDVLKLLLSESSLQPTAWNPNSFPAGQGAAGINQLAPVNWGIFQGDYTVQQYLQLTAEQQLPYVFKYFQNVMNGHGLSTISGRDLYWLNFLPAYYVPGATDAHVIVLSSSPYYGPNANLDHGHKGAILAGDLQIALDSQEAKHPTLWPLISTQMLQQEGGPTVPIAGAIVALGIFAGLSLAGSDIPETLFKYVTG